MKRSTNIVLAAVFAAIGFSPVSSRKTSEFPVRTQDANTVYRLARLSPI